MPPRADICIRCQFRAFLSNYTSSSLRWQSRRTMASAMRRLKRPARMTLSSDVARTPVILETGEKRKPPSPFGGMNQTEARISRRFAPRARMEAPKTTGNEDIKKPRPKASKDEKPLFHALKMQQMLTPLSYSQRGAIKEKLDSITSFDQFNLLPDVRSAIFTQALPGLIDLIPTPAQKLVIPALLSKKGEFQKLKKKDKDGVPQFDKFLLAAETGSGKTLGYLVPVIDAFKRQEEHDNITKAERKEKEEKEKSERNGLFDLEAPEVIPHSNMGRPRVLILVPSSELVAQVGKLVKAMSHTIKFKSAPISSSHSPTVIRNRLFNPNGIDFVVSTPHLIASIAEKDPNVLSRVTHIVVDEADSLLDRSFSPITCGIIDKAAPSLKQLILCSATIPRSLDTFMDRRFPDIKRLVTPKLHSISRRVQLGVIDIDKDPYRGNRSLACADTIWQIGKSVHEDSESHHTVKSMIVFVNEREQAEELAIYLASKGIEAVALTRDTTEQRQSEILSAFTTAFRLEGDEKPANGLKTKSFHDFVPFDNNPTAPSATSSSRSSKRLPNTKVLVTTDLGSRGIDTLAVRTILLFHPPADTITWVHRLGRTGRMGRRGRGIVFVGKNDRKDVVREVQDAMFRGQALI